MGDGVTLGSAAADYGRRCKSIGLERRKVAGLQDAMCHPKFKASHHALLDRLAAEYRQSKPLIERPPFATIEVGTFKEVADLHQAILDGGFRISNWASDLMGRPEFALVAPTSIDLYMATNAELGYPQGCTVAETFAAIKEIGGAKLPAEAGPQYRLQYPDQPLDEWRLMYMEPITGSDGYLRVFLVERDGHGLWLRSGHGRPGHFCSGFDPWVFRRKLS